mmetsp:Transcript_5305/g.19402  ORF Transcript_5305/g.19402 Transcript_5305/m.19402 type:complete len:100 (+) Transcript_5305:79-378(+)
MAFAVGPSTVSFSSLVAGRTNTAQQNTSARRSMVTMAKKKDVRIVITLECTEQRGEAAGEAPGVSRYTTSKNRRNTPNRLELMKYNKYLKRRTLHREIK